jgi:hypothetical protein
MPSTLVLFEQVETSTNQMNPEFSNFSSLLVHCLDLLHAGQNQRALSIVDEYLSDPRAANTQVNFWSEYSIHQSMGFKALALEGLDSDSALQANIDQAAYCSERLKYWLDATASAHAIAAISHFKVGRLTEGRLASQEAVRISGFTGKIDGLVEEAATLERESFGLEEGDEVRPKGD